MKTNKIKRTARLLASGTVVSVAALAALGCKWPMDTDVSCGVPTDVEKISCVKNNCEVFTNYQPKYVQKCQDGEKVGYNSCQQENTAITYEHTNADIIPGPNGYCGCGEPHTKICPYVDGHGDPITCDGSEVGNPYAGYCYE